MTGRETDASKQKYMCGLQLAAWQKHESTALSSFFGAFGLGRVGLV